MLSARGCLSKNGLDVNVPSASNIVLWLMLMSCRGTSSMNNLQEFRRMASCMLLWTLMAPIPNKRSTVSSMNQWHAMTNGFSHIHRRSRRRPFCCRSIVLRCPCRVEKVYSVRGVSLLVYTGFKPTVPRLRSMIRSMSIRRS